MVYLVTVGDSAGIFTFNTPLMFGVDRDNSHNYRGQCHSMNSQLVCHMAWWS